MERYGKKNGYSGCKRQEKAILAIYEAIQSLVCAEAINSDVTAL
ncbi:hypothetical protein [Aureimonas sp. AU40]|nr:hypothetical protein [Aureimonas sp. AU40]